MHGRFHSSGCYDIFNLIYPVYFLFCLGGGRVVRWCWVTSAPGRPINLHNGRTRAYCVCSRCGGGLFGHLSLVYHFSPLSPSLWEKALYRLKYCLKGPLNPKQPTYQTIFFAPSLWETARYRLTGCLNEP